MMRSLSLCEKQRKKPAELNGLTTLPRGLERSRFRLAGQAFFTGAAFEEGFFFYNCDVKCQGLGIDLLKIFPNKYLFMESWIDHTQKRVCARCEKSNKSNKKIDFGCF